jgi:hypothetical protein
MVIYSRLAIVTQAKGTVAEVKGWMLTALCKSGEANLVCAKVEGSVDVLHKAVTEEPDSVTEAKFTAYESTNTSIRAGPHNSENKATTESVKKNWSQRKRTYFSLLTVQFSPPQLKAMVGTDEQGKSYQSPRSLWEYTRDPGIAE